MAAQGPQVLLQDYTLTLVSDGEASDSVSQMAFKPGDDAHLFAVQTTGAVVRFDYDPIDGSLSNAVTVAGGLGQSLGPAFHGDDLYVSMDLGGSVSERPGDGRISRLSDPDAAGVYQVRHDSVQPTADGGFPPAPDSGGAQVLVDDLDLPTGVVADPFGNLLISDLVAGSIWRLVPPPALP